MQCSRCRLTYPPTEMHYISNYKVDLCDRCLTGWVFDGRKPPIYTSKKWRFSVSLAIGVAIGLCLLSLTFAAIADEPLPVLAKTCYWTQGARSYPFSCTQYEFKGHTYWVGRTLSGHIWQVEEETPEGQIVLYHEAFTPELEV